MTNRTVNLEAKLHPVLRWTLRGLALFVGFGTALAMGAVIDWVAWIIARRK